MGQAWARRGNALHISQTIVHYLTDTRVSSGTEMWYHLILNELILQSVLIKVPNLVLLPNGDTKVLEAVVDDFKKGPVVLYYSVAAVSTLEGVSKSH